VLQVGCYVACKTVGKDVGHGANCAPHTAGRMSVESCARSGAAMRPRSRKRAYARAPISMKSGARSAARLGIA
jgi:hypothetical protein